MLLNEAGTAIIALIDCLLPCAAVEGIYSHFKSKIMKVFKASFENGDIALNLSFNPKIDMLSVKGYYSGTDIPQKAQIIIDINRMTPAKGISEITFFLERSRYFEGDFKVDFSTSVTISFHELIKAPKGSYILLFSEKGVAVHPEF